LVSRGQLLPHDNQIGRKEIRATGGEDEKMELI